MKRKIALLAAATAMLLAGLFPATVSAASTGGCNDFFTQNYVVAENYGDNGEHPTGVQAEIDPPSSTKFALCSPDDGDGQNASAAQIGFKNQTSGAFIYFGLIRCVRTEKPEQAGVCADQKLHLVVETDTSFPLDDYNMYDFGSSDPGGNLYGPNIFKVDYNTPQDKFYVYFNGTSLFANGLHVTGLNPASDIVRIRMLAETHDTGDGLGNNVSGESTNFGSTQRRDPTGTWHTFGTGGSCDNTDPQIHCVANGSTGMYVYTTN